MNVQGEIAGEKRGASSGSKIWEVPGSSSLNDGPWKVVQKVRRPRRGNDQIAGGSDKQGGVDKPRVGNNNSGSRFVALQDKPGFVDLDEDNSDSHADKMAGIEPEYQLLKNRQIKDVTSQKPRKDNSVKSLIRSFLCIQRLMSILQEWVQRRMSRFQIRVILCPLLSRFTSKVLVR